MTLQVEPRCNRLNVSRSEVKSYEMKISSSSVRIVLGLVSLTVSAVLVAGLLGLIPNVGTSAQRNRASFCEAAAVSFMALAPRMNEQQIQKTFESIRERNPEVESIAARKLDDGRLVFASGPHTLIWQTVGTTPITSREFIVPIATNHGDWGQLEIRFTEVAAGPCSCPLCESGGDMKVGEVVDLSDGKDSIT